VVVAGAARGAAERACRRDAARGRDAACR